MNKTKFLCVWCSLQTNLILFVSISTFYLVPNFLKFEFYLIFVFFLVPNFMRWEIRNGEIDTRRRAKRVTPSSNHTFVDRFDKEALTVAEDFFFTFISLFFSLDLLLHWWTLEHWKEKGFEWIKLSVFFFCGVPYKLS